MTILSDIFAVQRVELSSIAADPNDLLLDQHAYIFHTLQSCGTKCLVFILWNNVCWCPPQANDTINSQLPTNNNNKNDNNEFLYRMKTSTIECCY